MYSSIDFERPILYKVTDLEKTKTCWRLDLRLLPIVETTLTAIDRLCTLSQVLKESHRG